VLVGTWTSTAIQEVATDSFCGAHENALNLSVLAVSSEGLSNG
jgi:hypothetical protein